MPSVSRLERLTPPSPEAFSTSRGRLFSVEAKAGTLPTGFGARIGNAGLERGHASAVVRQNGKAEHNRRPGNGIGKDPVRIGKTSGKGRKGSGGSCVPASRDRSGT